MSHDKNDMVGTLRIGMKLIYDGEPMMLDELHGDLVLLRHTGRGGSRVVSLARLAATATLLGQQPCPAREALGHLVDGLTGPQRTALLARTEHVREVLTGFRDGSPGLARPGEPRPQYGPGTSLMARYVAKAAELGVGRRTVRRWVAGYQQDGPAGVLDARSVGMASPLGRVDVRWLDAARLVIADHADASTPTRSIMIERATVRVEAEYGPGVVPTPARPVAYRVMKELLRGRGFDGAAKWRRSIASRPTGVYGRLRATRPGEYVFLDTNSLDVFAMEQVTHRWVQVQLTVALDLFDRCVVGIRLAPVSTRAVDVARLLYDVITPQPAPADWAAAARWPYHGLPTGVVVDVDQLERPRSTGRAAARGGARAASASATSARAAGAAGAAAGGANGVARGAGAGAGELAGPVVAPETLVIDHGRIYVSQHVQSVCARLGISIQPARPYRGSDKGPLERWFRTLRQGLLEKLPGYKGPDVHGRGRAVEEESYFFLHELDAIIREWTATVYHRRPQGGLAVPEMPGLKMSPYDMYEYGIAKAGFVQIPARPDLGYDFLATCGRRIQHYGVDVHGLKYNGSALDPYRNTTSPYTGRYAGKWPIRFDPDDVRQVYFQDPTTHEWHPLVWEHAAAIDGPFSRDALAYARKLAVRTQRFPDDRLALRRLLDRWQIGLVHTPQERRIALQLARQDAALLPAPPGPEVGEPAVTELGSVRAVLDPLRGGQGEARIEADDGDDDLEEELDAAADDEPTDQTIDDLGDDGSDDVTDDVTDDVSDEEFYADALGSVE